jgi:hypothetical protein
MFKRLVLAASALSLVSVLGCASNSTPPAVAVGVPSTETASGSAFDKIHVGEEISNVYAEIGPPNFTETTYNNLAWVPLRYGGNDDVRQLAHYKGVGRITFSNDVNSSSGFSVLSIDNDASEPGY